MPLNAAGCNAQIDTSQSAMAMLNASCQAVIQAEIAPFDSPWYATLDRELGGAEELVVSWRRSGTLYFQTDILTAIGACGGAFTARHDEIARQFAELEQSFSVALRDAVVANLAALQAPVQNLSDQTRAYCGKLQSFEDAMLDSHQTMQTTIGQVQAQEQQIAAEIAAINAHIAALKQQIEVDRQAIAAARSAETRGIVETIFGVVLAPFTGGASLILAGIGAASIADAEGKVAGMQSQISTYQQDIVADQGTLTDDQKTVACLNGLTLSTGYVLDDINAITQALDALRTTWTVFGGELATIVTRLGQAMDTREAIVANAWFESACSEWALIDAHVTAISNPSVTTHRRQIG